MTKQLAPLLVLAIRWRLLIWQLIYVSALFIFLFLLMPFAFLVPLTYHPHHVRLTPLRHQVHLPLPNISYERGGTFLRILLLGICVAHFSLQLVNIRSESC